MRPEARDWPYWEAVPLRPRRQRQVRFWRPDSCVEAGPPRGQGLRSGTLLTQQVEAGEEIPLHLSLSHPPGLSLEPLAVGARGVGRGAGRGCRVQRCTRVPPGSRQNWAFMGGVLCPDGRLRSPSSSGGGQGEGTPDEMPGSAQPTYQDGGDDERPVGQ